MTTADADLLESAALVAGQPGRATEAGVFTGQVMRGSTARDGVVQSDLGARARDGPVIDFEITDQRENAIVAELALQLEQAYSDAVALHAKLPKADSHALAVLYTNLANLYTRWGKHRKASKMAQKANAVRNHDGSSS